MCGIAGVVTSDGSAVDGDLAERMALLMRHRGPDDTGLWVAPDRRVALAHRRLSILDLTSAGHQPMATPDGEICLVYNGEIYNYVELRSELIAKGHTFRSRTDTEVLLLAYREWGTGCLQRFNGMFSFALWDVARGRLFAARDRFGEKPFYFARPSGRFLFASEIKALLLDPQVSQSWDPVTVSEYLTLGRVDGTERTFYAEVSQLLPAHFLTLNQAGELKVERYWDVDAEREIRFATPDSYAEGFRELFADSVRVRLRSDVTVGTSLSGGLDSSAVVGMVNELLRGSDAPPQNTFSARHRSIAHDEGRYIEQVVALTGARDHHVWIDGEQMLLDVDRFLWHQDEPVPHTNQYAQWKVMELAQQHGVTVLLDGQGADEYLAGYHPPAFGYRYADLLRRGSLGALLRDLREHRSRHGSLISPFRYMAGAMIPDKWWQTAKQAYIGSRGLLRAGALPALPASGERSVLMRRFPSPLKAILYETLTRTSLPSLLRYGDRSSMAFSREARLAFLDHRLVEYVFALPDDQLVDRGATKVVLRRATQDLLPPGVRDRMDKIGFATPEQTWFRTAMRGWMDERLESVKRRDFIDRAAVDREWTKVQKGKGSTGHVWRMANLEDWLQRSAA
jgi:asparagine synthase (glutamine-hydrolysing)